MEVPQEFGRKDLLPGEDFAQDRATRDASMHLLGKDTAEILLRTDSFVFFHPVSLAQHCEYEGGRGQH